MKTIFFLLLATLCLSQNRDIEIKILNDSVFYGTTTDSVELDYYKNKVHLQIINSSDSLYLIHFDPSMVMSNFEITEPEEEFPFNAYIDILNITDKSTIPDGAVFIEYDYPLLDSMFLLYDQKMILHTLNYKNIQSTDSAYAVKKLTALKNQLLLPGNTSMEFMLPVISLPVMDTYSDVPPMYLSFYLAEDKEFAFKITLYNMADYLTELYSAEELKTLQNAGIKLFTGRIESNVIPMARKNVE